MSNSAMVTRKTPRISTTIGRYAARQYFLKMGLPVTVLVRGVPNAEGMNDFFIGLGNPSQIDEAVKELKAKTSEMVL